MRRETAGVTESLLDNAKKEFLEYGFHDASLRRISAVSGVSTNSIYTRFGDKAGLFEAIVKDAADGLMNIYLEGIGKVADAPDMEYVITEGTELVIEYIYQHKSEFELIFCKSAGTEYETYFDRLGAIEETYYKSFARQFSNANHKVDDFFIHVYCRTGWQYVYELITHGKTYEEAKKYMEDVCVFNFAGWKAIFERA